jgi:hypothetical protein
MTKMTLRKRNSKNISYITKQRKKEELLIAASNGSLEKMNEIIKNYNLDINSINDYNGNNILHRAILNENFNCIKYILNFNNFLILGENNYGHSALDIMILDKIALFDFNKKNINHLYKYILNIKMIIDFIIKNVDYLDEYNSPIKEYHQKLNLFLNEYTIESNIYTIYKALCKVFKYY